MTEMFIRVRLTGLLVLWLLVGASPVYAELQWQGRTLGISGGYDSNVSRVSEDAPPPGLKAEPDARALVYGAFAVGLNAGPRFESSLDVHPYYVKYGDETTFDRGDVLVSGAAQLNLYRRWWVETTNALRLTGYPNRDGWNRLFNSVRTKLVFRPSSRWWGSFQYRNLYRNNPRKNLDEMSANGVAASTNLSVTDRLSIAVLGQIDFQTIQFVFPRRESGRRTCVDVSGRYLVGRNTIILAKYLFQYDDMDIVFAQGTSFDKLGDVAEDATDGVFQSLRFLEDTDFNFSKHLGILSSHTRLDERTFIDLLMLYENKHLDEPVLERATRPKREDNVVVLQTGLEYEIWPGIAGLFHARFESSSSNDPDHDYRFLTIGLGLELTVGARE